MEQTNTTSLRSRTSNWFECLGRYEKTTEDGTQKKVTEIYVVDALSFTEAEQRFISEMKQYVSTDFEVKNINPVPYKEVFFSDCPDDDHFYLCRLAFITIDEKSEKEKRSYVHYLVQSSSTMSAQRVIDQVMSQTMIDYVVKSVKETKVIDVFEHENTTGK